jgi:hypothetical protein
MKRSAKQANIIAIALALTFLCVAIPAYLYFEALAQAAPFIGGGLPGLFPAMPIWQHPILILVILGLIGLGLTWLGLRLVNATLRESRGEMAEREARLKEQIDQGVVPWEGRTYDR